MSRIPAPLAFALIAVTVLALVGCKAGQRSVTMRNDTDKPVNIRLIHDSLFDGEKTLAANKLAPGDTQTLGPYRIPPLDPMVLEASISTGMGDLPLTYRIERPDVRLVFQSGGIESWSGLVITREAD